MPTGFYICNRFNDNCPDDCHCATEHVPIELSPSRLLCSEMWSTCMKRGKNGALLNQYCVCSMPEVGI